MSKLLPMQEYLEAVGVRTQRMADSFTVLNEQMRMRDRVIDELGQLVRDYRAMLEGALSPSINASDADAWWYADVMKLSERARALLGE